MVSTTVKSLSFSDVFGIPGPYFKSCGKHEGQSLPLLNNAPQHDAHAAPCTCARDALAGPRRAPAI